MRTKQWLPLVFAGAALLASPFALGQAPEEQACAKTRAEVKQECINFLATHRWDEAAGDYVLKSGAKLPEGVKTRVEIKAERDKFFSMNRWDESGSRWVPISGAPRDVSKMSREEMRKETQAFMKTHRWSEAKGEYVDVKPGK